MSVRKGAPQFSSLLDKCVLWFTGQESNEFPIIPSGVTVTPNGTFTKTSLGNNKSVVNFDGSTNYVTVGTVSTFNFLHQVGTAGKWSIAVWLKFAAFASDRSILINDGSTSTNHGIHMYVNSSRVLIFLLVGGVIICYGGITVTFPDNSDWHYLTVTYDQSLTSANVKFYLDGAASGSNTKTANTPSTSDASFVMKAFANSYNLNKFYGSSKDLMIWNGRVLTLPEIKLLMNRTHPITGTGMIAGPYDYYKVIS